MFFRSPPTFETSSCDFYRELFQKLEEFSEKEHFTLTPPTSSSGSESSKNILRVSIQNVGSLLWADDDCDAEKASKLTRFVFSLRSLARQHLMICFITISQDCRATLETKNASLSRIRSLCDVVIQLTPFNKNERKNGLYKDHHGVLVTHQKYLLDLDVKIKHQSIINNLQFT